MIKRDLLQLPGSIAPEKNGLIETPEHISSTNEATSKELNQRIMTLSTIRLSQIAQEYTKRSRKDLNDEVALMHHIRKDGYFVPAVIERQIEGKYSIVAGHKIVAAANLLDLEEIPVYLIAQ